jgi:diguanylate cyclase (GGDEF)-like protein
VGEEQEVRRTVSIGVAGYPDDAMDPEQLLQHADDALYRAKRAGRNCVLTA